MVSPKDVNMNFAGQPSALQNRSRQIVKGGGKNDN